MTNIYEVMVNTGEVEHIHKIYGLEDAINFCIECGLCDNVVTTHVVDTETGEIMWCIEHGIVVWVSGIGNPFEF